MPALAPTTIEGALRDVFGLAGFRPGQRAVVESVLAGRHTVAVMPTGAGKSLCYQLPAVVAGGTALVVSPLIALMKDQVDALADRGIPAAAITSGLAAGEVTELLAELAAGKLRLCYVAPERFRSPRFHEALARIGPRLSLLAIDEAHCISEWGHDFRPDYMRLGEVVQRLRPPRLVALTATATPEVRKDIAKQLGMHEPAFLVRGFDRPNLHFVVDGVRGGQDKLDKLRARVRGRAAGAALVYAATRKNAETYAEALASGKERVGVYHAGLNADERTAVQDRFMNGALDVVVATNAFGMGVDKADVRLVVHADLPRSPEAYYQEAGRGGRDGRDADCVVLFTHADVRLQQFLIDASCPSVDVLRALWKTLRDDPRRGRSIEGLGKSLPGTPSDGAVAAAARYLIRAGYLRDEDGVLVALRPGEDPDAPPAAPIDTAALSARAELERGKLQSMVDYAYATTCRRKYLLAYFGDEDARAIGACAACDVCLGTGKRDVSDTEMHDVHVVLRCVESLRGRFGRGRIAGVLAGNDDDDRLAEIPERGAFRGRGVRYAMDVLRALEGAGCIQASPGEYPTISITTLGRRVIAGGEKVRMAMPDEATRGKKRQSSRVRRIR
jgi:ATP-dependent DNA helicase RecQ